MPATSRRVGIIFPYIHFGAKTRLESICSGDFVVCLLY